PSYCCGASPGLLQLNDVSPYSRIFVYEDNSFNHNIINIITITTCNSANIQSNKSILTTNMIYPNPAQNSLQVRLINEQIGEIKINDVLGKEVICTKEKEIDIIRLQNGVYF